MLLMQLSFHCNCILAYTHYNTTVLLVKLCEATFTSEFNLLVKLSEFNLPNFRVSILLY